MVQVEILMLKQPFIGKQEMIVKHVGPPKLKCHCDLDLWPRNSKINRGHLLVMTSHHTKLEDPWAISSLVIDRTNFFYGPTDRPTYRPTDGPTYAKQYTPSSSKGGIIRWMYNQNNFYVTVLPKVEIIWISKYVITVSNCHVTGKYTM